MQRAILLLFVVAVIGACVYAALGGFAVGRYDGWSPRDYVTRPGECFVPPQGDPLYDEHYAQQVNEPNCRALVDQSQAHNLDAQTERTKIETRAGVIGVYAILFVVVSTLGLLVVAIIRGA